MNKLCKLIFLYFPLFLLMIISIFNMISAKIISSIYQNHALKQCIWFTLGIFILLIAKRISLSRILKWSPYFYHFGNILLLLVLFFGKNVNGAKAWFGIGPFSFQPSELMKFFLTVYLIHIVNNHKGRDIFLVLKILVATFIPSFLTFLEPDTGALIFYFLIAFAILLTSPISKKWLFILGSITCLGIILFFTFYFKEKDLFIQLFGTSFFYRMDRLIDFQHQSGMQLENALISIGSAGWFGFGIFHHPIYFPEAPTDFIIALTISNFGFVGGILCVLSYLFLDIFFLYLCITEEGYFKMFTACFLVIFLFSQVQNIFMNIGLLPIMGIPLPFLSYGGTNLIINFFFLGVILSHLNQKEKYPFRIF